MRLTSSQLQMKLQDKCRLSWTRVLSSFFLLLPLLLPLHSTASNLPTETTQNQQRVLLETKSSINLHLKMDSGGEFNEENEKTKESATEEEVKEVSALKNALKYFDAEFFSAEKVLEMGKGARDFNVPIYRANRKLVASEDGGLHDPSVLVFNPEWSSRSSSDAKTSQNINKRFSCPSASGVQKPNLDKDVAFMNVFELGHLLKTKQTTSQELTEIFLRRMKKYDHALEAVISYTEELAFKQAKRADDLLNQGVYLGPLHGIPYGLKDTISVPQYKTTWGSKTFQNQVIDMEAWVYKRLKAAGAVLIAKLVTGSLAYDDIWFGGRTRNPWNIEEFSTGSSAGPAASTSAGLVPFAVGSETAGSMTYPAARCGVTAIRPTFGMVGRTGVMSLSESLVISLAHSAEAPRIVPLFWMQYEERIRMTSHQKTLTLRIPFLLIFQNSQLDTLKMLRWRL